MKSILRASLLLAAIAGSAQASSTIDNLNRFAYGANIGWMDCRADGANGVVIGEFVCSGYIYAANVGWINLGGGAPVNGIQYQNNSAADFGVNTDGLGNLRGLAWGANIGWVNFEAQGAPKVDLWSGRLTGFVYGANVGWLSLSNALAFVQSDTIRPGADTDGDGIADAWELLHFGDLTTANSKSDFDHDGFTDLQEYLADTDPKDPSSNLRITLYSFAANGSPVTLTWNSRPTRGYRVLQQVNLDSGFPWTDVGLGLFAPDAGPTTTRVFVLPSSRRAPRFFEIEAFRPLAP